MIFKPSKYSISTRILFTTALLPLTLQGCSTAGGPHGSDDDYIDYTTDRLRTAHTPSVSAPAPTAPAATSTISASAPLVSAAEPTTASAAEPTMASALPREFRERDKIEPKIYAGLGLGVSQLQPDTSAAPGFSVDDEFGGGGQVTLGMDVNKHLSLEMHSADLGSAGLSPHGRINYHLSGASALLYAGQNRHRYARRGINGFGRIGMAMLDNSAINNVNYERTNDTQVLFGAGLEYNTRIGVGVRAEVISFDKDAQYGQVGLMYRFGKQRLPELMVEEPTPVVPFVAKPEPVAEPVIYPKPMVAAVIEPKDHDSDGVVDSDDQCPQTGVNISVDNRGCALFSGTLEGVNFHSNSARLTATAATILDGVTQTLKQYPQVNILITAHTDSNGNSGHNQQLSEDRARAVVEYLAVRGIPYEQMAARAYGERKPIDNNDTAIGRATNRRVELFATNKRRWTK